jgi:hypothetical protein
MVPVPGRDVRMVLAIEVKWGVTLLRLRTGPRSAEECRPGIG